MRRIDALKMIANQIDFLNGKFEGYKTEFTVQELGNADVILTTVEQFMIPKSYKKEVPHLHKSSSPNKDYENVNEWEE